MVSRVLQALAARARIEPTSGLLCAWLAATVTSLVAFAVGKASNVASIAGSEIGRRQLEGELGLTAVAGWLWADTVAALLVGGVLALAFGGPRGVRGRRLATAGLALAGLALAAVVVVCAGVYDLFGTGPTWQLLDALSDADDTTDSVADLLAPARLLSFAGLALVLALGTPLLRRVFERRPRIAARIALALAAVAVLAGVGAASSADSNFELHQNPLLTFARTAVLGQTLGDTGSGVADFAEVLAPIADGPRAAGDVAPYDALAAWAGERGRPNVVVVVLETMAADHMGLFGGPVANTPTFAALADEGILWRRHYAHTPSSMFSIYAILCGNHGTPQGTHITRTRPRIDCRSMSEALTEVGYRAGLFHSGRHSYSRKNLFFAGRGYEVAHDTQTMPNRERYRETSWGIEEAASLDALLAWIDRDREAPFFVTYIPVYPHHPYTVPDPAYEKFPGRGNEARYRNSIYYIDQMIARLLTELRERGEAEDTLFVFVGDHGEGFGEHPGSKLHGSKLYDEAVHTFALWYAPGALPGGAAEERPTGQVDVAPTLFDVLGLPAAPSHPSRSLRAPGPRPMVPLYTGYGHPLVGFVDGAYKFLHDRRSGRSELYHLEDDPAEQRSLVGEHPELVARYQERVGRFVANQKAWEDALPDLADELADFDGRDASWTADPAQCTYPPRFFEVEDGALRMRRGAEKTVTCRHPLPDAAGAVTGFTARGAEAYNGAFITAMVVWQRGGERRQVAYCTLNGNSKQTQTECEAKLVPGETELGGGGELVLELRYVTRERVPLPERFRVDAAEVRYRLRD